MWRVGTHLSNSSLMRRGYLMRGFTFSYQGSADTPGQTSSVGVPHSLRGKHNSCYRNRWREYQYRPPLVSIPSTSNTLHHTGHRTCLLHRAAIFRRGPAAAVSLESALPKCTCRPTAAMQSSERLPSIIKLHHNAQQTLMLTYLRSG